MSENNATMSAGMPASAPAFGSDVKRLPLKDLLKRIGPGLIATGIVIGPGAVTTASMIGANYGYDLMWLFFPIIFMGITFMMVTNRLAIVTGMPTIHAIRKYYGPVASGIVGCAIFLSCLFFTMGNISGTGAGMNLIFGIDWKIGSVISDVVYAGISGSFRVIFGAIFGFVYAPLVITGLHHMSNAIDMQLIADFGGTMLWPMIALSNIAQGSAVLGMIYLQRKNADAQEVNVPSCISCYLGVTEPAMFGVNLKFHFPFICGMIGSAIAAAVCVATSTTANAIGVGGIPGILSIQPAYMLSFALCMVIAIVVPFVLTVSVGKKKGIA